MTYFLLWKNVIILCFSLFSTVSTEQNKSCGEEFNSNQGQFSSPNFPEHYDTNESCQWIIMNSNGFQVEINFEAFMLEKSENCSRAYLEIGFKNNRHDVNIQNLTRYCGSKKLLTLKTNKPIIFINLKTGNEAYPGFDAVFSKKQIKGNITKRGRMRLQQTLEEVEITEVELTEVECQCGISAKQVKQNKRIVGGSQSARGKFPWMAVLVVPFNSERAHCGATVLTKKFAITASHCLFSHQPSDFYLLAGLYNMALRSKCQQKSQIKEFYMHEKYIHATETNDIAILELETPFEFTPCVQPVCLPEKGMDFVGEMSIAAGWGRVSYMGQNSALPMEVELPVMKQKKCIKAFADTNADISDGMMCAGVLDGSKDACQGDSGGPLMFQNKTTGQWSIIGLTSYGVKCATVGYPGVYTKVSHYIEWILEKISAENICLNVNFIDSK